MTTDKAPPVPAVYKAIAACSAAISKEGISKNRKNAQQGWTFRGIDDVYNALSGLLPLHGLVILPRVLERECVERQTRKGDSLFYVVVKVEFDLVASEDGSRHVVTTYGEAMDSADKATNKAMSAAYKYMSLQVFCIPLEGEDNDADAVTHDPAPARRPAPAPARPTAELIAAVDRLIVGGELTQDGIRTLLLQFGEGQANATADLSPASLRSIIKLMEVPSKVALLNQGLHTVTKQPLLDVPDDANGEDDPPMAWTT
jgi:hypothetical protein